jgi:hypothetical protein
MDRLPAELTVLNDRDLSDLIALAQDEQRRRAIEQGDLDALIELGFADGFSPRGESKDPWLVGGLLVCPGYRKQSGGLSYRASFVSVDGVWVWQCDAMLDDVVRSPSGRQHEVTTVTVIAVSEGLEYDVVRIKSKAGGRDMGGSKSYRISGGRPVVVSTRQPKALGGMR